MFSLQSIKGLLIVFLNNLTQVKLQEEIDDLMESKEEGDEINAEDITNMNYLDQVQKKEL